MPRFEDVWKDACEQSDLSLLRPDRTRRGVSGMVCRRPNGMSLGQTMNTKIRREVDPVPMSLACAMLLLATAMTNSVHASGDLWDVLKKGGKVVLMRHAPVERGAGSGNPLVRDPSCRSERNLSDRGKRNAELIGRRFREHDIPVGSVLHSPFCRTAATAQIAFGTAFAAEYLSLLEVLSADEAAKQTEQLNRVIGSYSGRGNLVLVTHEPNIGAVSFEQLKHLDVLVIEPRGGKDFEEVGVIRFSESE